MLKKSSQNHVKVCGLQIARIFLALLFSKSALVGPGKKRGFSSHTFDSLIGNYSIVDAKNYDRRDKLEKRANLARDLKKKIATAVNLKI